MRSDAEEEKYICSEEFFPELSGKFCKTWFQRHFSVGKLHKDVLYYAFG
jgi:hypothetical protein